MLGSMAPRRKTHKLANGSKHLHALLDIHEMVSTSLAAAVSAIQGEIIDLGLSRQQVRAIVQKRALRDPGPFPSGISESYIDVLTDDFCPE